jgi:hypothetical protein
MAAPASTARAAALVDGLVADVDSQLAIFQHLVQNTGFYMKTL